MTGWGGGRVLSLDTETSGLNLEEDRIVTACAAIVDGGEVVYQRSWLLAVDVEIPAEAEAVHGISTAKARAEGIDPAKGIREIATAVQFAVRAGIALVAFNAQFDLTLLDREVRRTLGCGLADFCGGNLPLVIDPLVIDKATDRYRSGSRKLVDTCVLFGVELGEAAHDATADAVAAARLAQAMWRRSQLSRQELQGIYADRRYPSTEAQKWLQMGRHSLAELHDLQVGWYREQAENFAAYLRRTAEEKVAEARAATDRDEFNLATDLRAEAEALLARADDVTVEWPMRPLTDAVPVKAVA